MIKARILLLVWTLSMSQVSFPETRKPSSSRKSSDRSGMIGAQIFIDNATSEVRLVPLKGSPAAKAGIKKEDTLLAVNGNPVPNPAKGLGTIVDQIRGPVGTTVRLKLRHKGQTKSTRVSVMRVSTQSLAMPRIPPGSPGSPMRRPRPSPPKR